MVDTQRRDMLLSRGEARGRNESDLTGARADWTDTHGTTGGPRKRRRRRRRRKRRKRRDRQGNDTAVCSSQHLRNWKVLLWVAVSLLPLVEGVRLGTAGPDRAVGRPGGVEQRQLPDTLPEVREKEEEPEGREPYALWQPLYEPYVIEEAEDHPGGRWAGRSPRSSSGPSEATPQAAPKKKKKKKRKGKERERGSEAGGKGKGKRRGRPPPPQTTSRDCRVEKRETRVRDLGLGFDSDEIVLFKFCVGSCQSSRANYDLALRALLDDGSLFPPPRRRAAQRVATRPCCRPDRYEPVSFMDAHAAWRTIRALSAASCACIG